MALIKLAKEGYGQLELNFAAFRRNGAIEAQCKLADGIDYVENGMLLAVDRKNRTVGYPTGAEGEVIALNYTTEHMYDEREEGLKHFKLDKNTFLPRLGYIGTPDKFTTNTVCYEGDENTDLTTFVYGRPCTTEGFKGYIELVAEKDARCVVEVIEITTMPDGQKAVKFAGLN
jgi:hypothetical protein